MSTFLWIGTLLGALAGLCHAVAVYRQQVVGSTPARAIYFSFWTLLLWALFGAYLLAFWLLGVLSMGLARFLGRKAGMS